jgi:hypothetical protein
MGEANSPSVAHVGYDIFPLSRVKLATEGESIFKLDKKTRTIKMSLLADDIKRKISIAINEIEIFWFIIWFNLKLEIKQKVFVLKIKTLQK